MPTSDGPAPADIPDKTDPRLHMVMGEANKAYDRQDFDDAARSRRKVLQKHPTNARMLRIMVSSYCIEGDKEAAQTYYDKLPHSIEQMKQRCATYGMTFNSPVRSPSGDAQHSSTSWAKAPKPATGHSRLRELIDAQVKQKGFLIKSAYATIKAIKKKFVPEVVDTLLDDWLGRSSRTSTSGRRPRRARSPTSGRARR